MSNISDIIEDFILQQLEEDGELDLSRNGLASFFNCAPSQINYVLSTRFTNNRGFLTESKRGGGGFIRLTRLDIDKDEYLHLLIKGGIGDEIDQNSAMQIVDNLLQQSVIDEGQYNVITSVISNKSLANPIKIENRLRANILKNILINILKGEERC